MSAQVKPVVGFTKGRFNYPNQSDGPRLTDGCNLPTAGWFVQPILTRLPLGRFVGIIVIRGKPHFSWKLKKIFKK